MYKIVGSRRYERAYKRISRRKDFRQERLDQIINTLAAGKKLSAAYRDHALTGEYEGMRECHVQFDILLIYQIRDRELVLILINIGSHPELFG